MWKSVGVFYLKKDWHYSNPVQGEIFRVKSSYISDFNNQYLKGVVASIFVDNESTINLVESRKLSYRSEPEIFTFYFPFGLGQPRIGVKRLDSTNLDWTVEIEVLQSLDPIKDFENYLLSRFGATIGELMPLYNRGSGITPQDIKSDRISLNAREGKKILEANSRRRNLSIANGSSTLLIYGGVDDKNNPVNTVTTVLPNEVYDFPVNNGLYMGEVWAMNLTTSFATAGYTEFNAPQ